MKLKFVMLALGIIMLFGCVGTVVGTATSATIAIVKAPFKVAGAVIDGVRPEDDEDRKE